MNQSESIIEHPSHTHSPPHTASLQYSGSSLPMKYEKHPPIKYLCNTETFYYFTVAAFKATLCTF